MLGCMCESVLDIPSMTYSGMVNFALELVHILVWRNVWLKRVNIAHLTQTNTEELTFAAKPILGINHLAYALVPSSHSTNHCLLSSSNVAPVTVLLKST